MIVKSVAVNDRDKSAEGVMGKVTRDCRLR